jgi:hypothetical protein
VLSGSEQNSLERFQRSIRKEGENMAQMTGQMSFKDAKVEYNTSSGSAGWVDISGYANSVKVSGMDRSSKDTETFDGDTPISTYGKRSAGDVTIKAIYTSGSATGNPFQPFGTAYAACTAMYIRVSPQGLLTSGSSGTDLFTFAEGRVITPPIVSGDAGSADAVQCEFKVHSPYFTRSSLA